MLDRTQEEVMQSWLERASPLVSICCTTYNHEKYLGDAINSFLMQETDFPFEVLINDDCSTDDTQKIILQYVEKYPGIIKTIFQKKNQYSQGKKLMPFLFEFTKGDYFALCEGDDYWTDKRKLQIQLDEMKKHPECGMSFHPAITLKKDKLTKVISKQSDENKVFTTSEVILGGGGFCPTASLIFKKEVVTNLPDWFYKKAPVGDYFLQILGSATAGALYINKFMSIYRIGHEGSWTERTHRNKVPTAIVDKKKLIKNRRDYLSKYLEALDSANIYLDNNYANEFNYAKAGIFFSLAILYLRNKYYIEYKKTMEISYRTYKLKSPTFILLYNFRMFPRTAHLIRKIVKKY